MRALVCGAITNGLELARRTVWPSGAERATWSVAMVAFAPGRFSTTTGTPSSSCNRGCTMRAVTSFDPPGG